MPVPTPTRRHVGVLALAAAVGLLTGCSSGGDDAAAGAPSSSTTSGSGTPAGSTTAAGTTASSAAPSSSGGTSGSAASYQVTATEGEMFIRLDRTDLAAGEYTITVDNQGDASHDLVVERDGRDVAESARLAPGRSGTVTVTLEPGEYVFYCSIANHRAMGMETTVRVS